MDRSASRRRFLRDMTTLGAVSGVCAAFAGSSRAAEPPRMAQAGAAPRAGAAESATATGGLPLVHLMIGPGTLPSVGKDRMDLVRYRLSGNQRLTGEQMLEALPEIAKIARIEVDTANPYAQASHEDLRKLALRAEEVLRRPEVAGMIYVQGTNTLEETAYFLGLTVHSEKPIVVTGAQRPFNGLSSDAQMNLLDSVRLACAPQSRGKGALVAFNGEINAAREVTKTNTYHLHTFRTRDLGLLGYIDADRIEYYRTPHRRHTVNSEFSLASVESLPYVEVAYIHTGTRAGVAKALLGLGAKGIVLATVGAGAPGSLDKELEQILKDRSAVVVQSSRVGEGRIVRNNNWYEPGMVAADNLSPQKAAILLALALTKTSDPDEIQRVFDQY
ncbi:MAG: asparaginase [Alphaproteobacteria bacterium]|nr:MAG: asparaginase [Alphaproteobacteria bacterium]